jgi:hypothetical protein
MIRQMTNYFSAEKQESLLFIAVGILAIGVGVWLWMNGHRLKSMAFPLVAVAMLQVAVGASVYLRTDAQLAGLSRQVVQQPEVTRKAETTRMQTVMKNFSIYKAVEMLLLVVGLLLIVFWQANDVAAGIGAGLVLQSAFTLCLDLFAEARGQDYLKALATFTP